MLRAKRFNALLYDASTHFGNRPFLLRDPILGEVTYTEVFQFANGLQRQFDELGIEAGDSVATLFHNSGMAALLFLSIIATRRVLVPLNPLYTAYELEYVLKRARCAAVIHDPADNKCANFNGRSSVAVTDHREYLSKTIDNALKVDVSLEKLHCNDRLVGEIVFTSGSTGRPKGVVLSEENVLANASSLAQVYQLCDTDRFLTVCPLFHNSGQVFTTLACMLVGGSTVAIKSDIGMLHFWSYIDKYRPQWSFGMNSFLALLLARPGGPREPELMRGLLTGGSAIDGAVVERFEARFQIPVRTVYGLTETSSISTCEYLDPNPRSSGSSGRPLPICDVKIQSQHSSSERKETGAYERGEILIRGDNLFEGYVDDPELTKHRKSGGWLHTGDIGYFDHNGNLFVVDRVDSMLIVGGENVYPAEVEILCPQLPGATQILLVGLKHDILGNELVLVYTADKDISPSIDQWHRVLAENLVAAKLPQRYVAMGELGQSEFPKKENGKIDRQAVLSLVKKWARRC